MKTMNLFGTEIKYGSMFDYPDYEKHFVSLGGVGPSASVELPVFKEVTKHKKILFDVGSSFGWFSYVFCGGLPSRKSYAFDAGIRPHLSVQQTIVLNDLKNIMPVRTLIGDRDGLISVHHDTLQALMSANGQSQELIITVESACAIFDTIPDLLKIDVEGHEYHVLLGARSFIETYKPMIFIEIHPKYLPNHGKSIYDILNFFNSIGYTAYDLDKQQIQDYKEVLEKDLIAEEVYSNRFIWVSTDSDDFRHMETYKR
jgi:FkbM family methyltransferase